MPKVRYLDDCDIDCCHPTGNPGGGNTVSCNFDTPIGTVLYLTVTGLANDALACCGAAVSPIALYYDAVNSGGGICYWRSNIDVAATLGGAPAPATATPFLPCDATSFFLLSTSFGGIGVFLTATYYNSAGGTDRTYQQDYLTSYDPAGGFTLTANPAAQNDCQNWPATVGVA